MLILSSFPAYSCSCWEALCISTGPWNSVSGPLPIGQGPLRSWHEVDQRAGLYWLGCLCMEWGGSGTTDVAPALPAAEKPGTGLWTEASWVLCRTEETQQGSDTSSSQRQPRGAPCPRNKAALVSQPRSSCCEQYPKPGVTSGVRACGAQGLSPLVRSSPVTGALWVHPPATTVREATWL